MQDLLKSNVNKKKKNYLRTNHENERDRLAKLPLITTIYASDRTQQQAKAFRINNPSFIFDDKELYNSDIDISDDFISLNVDDNDINERELDTQIDTMSPFVDVSKYSQMRGLENTASIASSSEDCSNMAFDFLRLTSSRIFLDSDNEKNEENYVAVDKRNRYKSISPIRDYVNVQSRSRRSRFTESTKTKSTVLADSFSNLSLTLSTDEENSIDNYNYYEKIRLEILENQQNPTKFKRNTFATINTTDFFNELESSANQYENVMIVPASYSKNTMKKGVDKNGKQKSMNINECLDENLLVNIFSYLSTIDKLNLTFVCKKWHHIIWSKHYQYKLWNRINLDYNTTDDIKFNDSIIPSTPSTTFALAYPAFKTKIPTKKKPNADKLLKFFLNNPKNYPLCICVEHIIIRSNHRLTDKGIELIASRCPELKYLSLRNCSNIKTTSIIKLLLNCTNLKYIDLTGCFNITNIIGNTIENSCSSSSLTNINILPQPQLVYYYLQYVDLSDCTNITDFCIKNICKYCVYLKNFYLRRCKLISDLSLLHIAKHCRNLKELSLCQCVKITDTGMKYLSGDFTSMGAKKKAKHKLPAHRYKIKYLSLAKCPHISDKSLIYLANLGFFNQIKYLNLRGCVMITDKFVKYFTGSNSSMTNELNSNKRQALGKLPVQLKSIDLGKCSITNKSLEYLCRLVNLVPTVLQRLSLRNLNFIDDQGIRLVAINVKHLQHLNVAKCPKITANSLQEIKKNCKSCIIQHTSLTFC